MASIFVPIMATREASADTSSMLCVVRRIARSELKRWRTDQSVRLAPASRPVDGSSRRRTLGLPAGWGVSLSILFLESET